MHPQKTQKEQVCQRWSRPPDGWHKCNADGAFSAADNSGAVGVVLRDHDGRFLAGRAAWYARGVDAMFMEALACREALLLTRQCGATKVCLETDCLRLVNLWSSIDEQRSAVNLMLRDIRNLSRSFDEFSFVYASRSCNRVAHECARQVSCELNAVEWHVNPPLALHNLLWNDCNPIVA